MVEWRKQSAGEAPMAEQPAFQRKQHAFAAHIRDPARCPAPDGVEDRRMAIYRELFFNNLNRLLGKSFPVLRKVLGEDDWRALLRDYLVRHRAKTPYFLEIPREFSEFLRDSPPAIAARLPFLAELGHYEWAELAASVSTETVDLATIDRDGDLVNGVPAVTAPVRILSYRFPVHRISPDFLPAEPGAEPTWLAVYRKPDDELAFLELNAITAALLRRIAANERSVPGRELLLELATEIGYADPERLVDHGRAAMEELRTARVLLGTRRNPAS